VPGARLQEVLAKTSPLIGAMHATIAPADVDPAKTYTVATTDFVAKSLFPGIGQTGEDARTVTEAWLKAGAPGQVK
jgi:hypothetical protein